MAVILTAIKPKNSVTVYSRVDDAIDHNASDWTAYLEDPIKNEKALVFHPGKQPTRFICNFEFNGKDDAAIKDAMTGSIDSNKNMKVTMGAWQYEVVRRALKAIENPPGLEGVIELKLESGKLVDERTMTMLTKAGVSGDIFSVYLALKGDDESEKAQAKN